MDELEQHLNNVSQLVYDNKTDILSFEFIKSCIRHRAEEVTDTN